MKTIQRILKLNQYEYYKKHLSIVSCLLPTYLTPKEIEVLGAFMALDKSLIDEDMFNTLARKQVRDKLNMSSASLSNHLRSMIDKKVIDEKGGKLVLKEFLIPNKSNQGYQIMVKNIEV